MNGRRYTEADYQELLYSLLPAVYRARDRDDDLRKFVALFAHELARLRGNLDQLWRDFYIDSCQDWVVPYIGDLVGTSILSNEAARNRADVKNTIRWRRQKGTLPGLEDIAAEISGWGTHAVEMFERLIWSQNLNHLRPQAIHAMNLADASRLTRLKTPFDLSCRSVDLRPPDQRVGWHDIWNVNFFLFAIPSNQWKGADPVKQDAGRFQFHPLGIDQVLYAGGEKTAACASTTSDPATRADICFPHANHVPIRGRDVRDNPLTYFGQPCGFTVYEDGIAVAKTTAAVPGCSAVPCLEFSELAASGGLIVADKSLFGIVPKRFSIAAVRLGAKMTVSNGQLSPVPYSPAAIFSNNFVVANPQGTLDTTTFTYTKGAAFNPATPDFHHPVMLLKIDRLGADANFPECEVILRNSQGLYLLVFLPAIAGMQLGQPFHLYVADDGSTYFARATHDAGPVDRNPDASIFGAYLPRHLARGAQGQVRPRPGIRPPAHRQPVYRSLCCWDKPLQKPVEPGEVAFDPERGRFAFPAGEEPAGKLTVDFRFAVTGEVGAGPYFRGDLPAATLRVSKAADAPFQTIQAAINAAPAGGPAPVVIEIQDSGTYLEALTVPQNFPGDLVLQAGRLQMPVLRMPSPPPPGGNVLAVTGAVGKLVLDGLVISGGNISVTGNVPQVSVRFCSLDPRQVSLNFSPSAAGAKLELANSIAGPVTASANVDWALVSDAVLQHPAATIEHPEGHLALSSTKQVQLDRVTVLGEVSAGRLDASNTILFGPIQVTQAGQSCVRYSRYVKANAPAVRTFRSTSAFPVFVSIQISHPGYAHLHPNTPESIRKGGEEGGEMGAFYRVGIPWREQNLRIKLAEYLPAGMEAVPVRALPVARFLGVKRS